MGFAGFALSLENFQKLMGFALFSRILDILSYP